MECVPFVIEAEEAVSTSAGKKSGYVLVVVDVIVVVNEACRAQWLDHSLLVDYNSKSSQ